MSLVVPDAIGDLSLAITTVISSPTPQPPHESAAKRDGHKVVVPEWRHKTYTVSYKLEGIEDLTDDAFDKRHSKHEYDEKLIKKWDMRRQREEYERQKLLKGRQEASYLQPPRAQNKNKKPKTEPDSTTAPANVEAEVNLLQKAASLQYIEILDAKTEAILLKQMSKIATKLNEATPVAAPSRGRRAKDVQENKPPSDLASAKSKASGTAVLQAAATDNINNIIKTRKLLKSPVKSHPIISPLWPSETNSGAKKSVLSTSSLEPRGRYAAKRTSGGAPRKSELTDTSCNSTSTTTSIYDDIDLDFRTEAENMSQQRQRRSTRSRSSSRSFSVDNLTKGSQSDTYDSEQSRHSTTSTLNSQRKRRKASTGSSLLASPTVKRLRVN